MTGRAPWLLDVESHDARLPSLRLAFPDRPAAVACFDVPDFAERHPLYYRARLMENTTGNQYTVVAQRTRDITATTVWFDSPTGGESGVSPATA